MGFHSEKSHRKSCSLILDIQFIPETENTWDHKQIPGSNFLWCLRRRKISGDQQASRAKRQLWACSSMLISRNSTWLMSWKCARFKNRENFGQQEMNYNLKIIMKQDKISFWVIIAWLSSENSRNFMYLHSLFWKMHLSV